MSPDDETGTRKGRPGSKATFPNGLRDVHEISYAEASQDSAFQAAERNGECQASIYSCMSYKLINPVMNLLNPCHCKTTGICKCCKPKTERRSRHSPGPSLQDHAAPPRKDGQPIQEWIGINQKRIMRMLKLPHLVENLCNHPNYPPIHMRTERHIEQNSTHPTLHLVMPLHRNRPYLPTHHPHQHFNRLRICVHWPI
jgi:hypothetical protein